MKTRRPLIALMYPPYLALMTLAVLALSLYASHEIKTEHVSKIREQLENHARAFQRILEESAQAGAPTAWETPVAQAEIDRLCKRFGETLTSRITVILPSLMASTSSSIASSINLSIRMGCPGET